MTVQPLRAPSKHRRFLVEKIGAGGVVVKRRYISSSQSAAKAATEGWLVWTPWKTGWSRSN